MDTLPEKGTPEYFDAFKVASFEHWEVYMHTDQAYLGRVYVTLKRKNGELDNRDMFELTKDERENLYNSVMPAVKRVLQNLFYPDKFDYANLQNEWPHLHIHVVPRYRKVRKRLGEIFRDRNWGKHYKPYPPRILEEEVLVGIRDMILGEFADA